MVDVFLYIVNHLKWIQINKDFRLVYSFSSPVLGMVSLQSLFSLSVLFLIVQSIFYDMYLFLYTLFITMHKGTQEYNTDLSFLYMCIL